MSDHSIGGWPAQAFRCGMFTRFARAWFQEADAPRTNPSLHEPTAPRNPAPTGAAGTGGQAASGTQSTHVAAPPHPISPPLPDLPSATFASHSALFAFKESARRSDLPQNVSSES